jgi:hypothetical protein
MDYLTKGLREIAENNITLYAASFLDKKAKSLTNIVTQTDYAELSRSLRIGDAHVVA